MAANEKCAELCPQHDLILEQIFEIHNVIKEVQRSIISAVVASSTSIVTIVSALILM